MAPSITPSSTHYALVIDAGSSGSRLQIYSWRDPDLERAEILKEVQLARDGRGGSRWWWNGYDGIKSALKGKGKARESDMERLALRRLVRVGKGVQGDAWVKRVEPGISTISPEDIPAYLAPLLSHALQQIPPSQHSTTPIYVLATAGMRLLSDQARDAILQSTCHTLQHDYPFAVGGPSCSDNVRVISGEEEGIWGWVAVNYLMDGFGHAPPSIASTSSRPTSTGLLPLSPLAEPPPDSSSSSVTPVDVNHHSPTFGFLDMGGASTQLAFSPSVAEIERSGYPGNELEKVSLRLLSGETVEWPVFVASWLGFGTNKARERYTDQLISKWRLTAPTDLSTPIPDPCLPTGLEISSPEPSLHPGFLGTGSFSTCLTELRPLLDHAHPCPTNHCLFGGVSTPHIDFAREDQRGFIGVSEYWYTAQQVLGLGGVWDWGEWEKGMGEFCQRDWKKIESQVEKEQGWLGAEVELSRLQLQCFKGAWISNVLHEGIGIPRLVDAGGNDTLTGGDLGDTNAEAERRAREKGLIEVAGKRKGKSHFQSMDEIGETAISWTLGKMVIEASKAVQPRSAALEAAWTSRLPALGLGHVEQRLNDLGIQTIWAYGFMSFVLIVCIFNSLKRRFRWTWSFFPSPRSGGRSRKPSISGDAPFVGLSPKSTWSWPWSTYSSAVDSPTYSLEDGLDITPVKTRATIGRLRLWSLRFGNMLKRHAPFVHSDRPRTMRHASMPLSSTAYSQIQSGNQAANGWSTSTPPSPTRSSGFFFTPALSVPPPNPSSALSMASSTSSLAPSAITHSPGASPPRLKGTGKPPRQRQNSNNGTSLGMGFNAKLGIPDPNGTGWNDPPISLLTHSGLSDGGGGGSGSGILTPTARSGNGYEHTISRQSSRVNLSELGLAQRSASRATTPLDFDDGTHLVG